MLLYHGSNTFGLTQLCPRRADHDRPYVYLTTIEQVAAMYLCNAVQRPFYWFPYGFEQGSDVPVYHELYPDALREVSQGVRGCIYTVDAKEGEYIPFKDIPCARLGTVPLEVVGCTEVEDAYTLMQRYMADGSLRVSRFEDKSPEQLDGWYRMVAAYLKEKGMAADCSYARFVRRKLPRAWEIYCEAERQL